MSGGAGTTGSGARREVLYTATAEQHYMRPREVVFRHVMNQDWAEVVEHERQLRGWRCSAVAWLYSICVICLSLAIERFVEAFVYGGPADQVVEWVKGGCGFLLGGLAIGAVSHLLGQRRRDALAGLRLAVKRIEAQSAEELDDAAAGEPRTEGVQRPGQRGGGC